MVIWELVHNATKQKILVNPESVEYIEPDNLASVTIHMKSGKTISVQGTIGDLLDMYTSYPFTGLSEDDRSF